MTTKPSAARPSPILMLAPLAFVLIAYNYFFNIPQQRELSALQATLNRLDSQSSTVRHEHGHVMGELARMRRQEQQLRQQLEIAKAAQSRVVTERQQQLADLFRPARPAASMAQAVALLERHRLTCLDNRSSGVSSNGKPAATHEALKPIADLLGGAPKEGSTRSEYRIKLSGRYADLRRALHELLETQPDVMPLAIEMEAPDDLRTDRRIWVLTLLV